MRDFGCLRKMPDEIRVGRNGINPALAELELVRLTLQVGSDNVDFVCGDPRTRVIKLVCD